jgi:hypothetical protein
MSEYLYYDTVLPKKIKDEKAQRHENDRAFELFEWSS